MEGRWVAAQLPGSTTSATLHQSHRQLVPLTQPPASDWQAIWTLADGPSLDPARTVSVLGGNVPASIGRLGLGLSMGLLLGARRRASRRWRAARHCSQVRRRAAAQASASALAELLAEAAPRLAETARIDESRKGDGLGLFATRALQEGEPLCAWGVDSPAFMEPLQQLADKFEAQDFGALAFQVLRASRSQQPSLWKKWVESGVSAPETHPLRLAVSDLPVAKQLWSSTTCGGRMSASALSLGTDLQLLQGTATLEDWAEAVALVMSRCIVEDEDGRPLLALGLDLLQDGEESPNVEVKVQYEEVGGGPLSFGGESKRVLSGIILVASRDIDAGEELTTNYFPYPQGGRYLERYGFLPERCRGELVEVYAELSFAPTDEEEDELYYDKANLLVDLEANEGITIPPGPMTFYFSSEGSTLQPQETQEPWEERTELEKMVHILRLRNLGEKDAFLLDGVYIEDVWNQCGLRISKDNEMLVATTIIEECDRWLERFAIEEDEEEPQEEILRLAREVARTEAEILVRLKTIFSNEMRDAQYDTKRLYWVDRAMMTLFPMRAVRNASGVIEDP